MKMIAGDCSFAWPNTCSKTLFALALHPTKHLGPIHEKELRFRFARHDAGEKRLARALEGRGRRTPFGGSMPKGPLEKARGAARGNSRHLADLIDGGRRDLPMSS